jgi:hypothetical protein
MKKAIQEWQTLIAGVSLALSVAYAGTVLLKVSFSLGQGLQQHEQILQILHEKCK